MEGLTVGRIVHYVLPTTLHRLDHTRKTWEEYPNVDCGKHRAAIVVEVQGEDAGTASLFVFHSHSAPELITDGVPYSEAQEPGTWHWIERA